MDDIGYCMHNSLSLNAPGYLQEINNGRDRVSSNVALKRVAKPGQRRFAKFHSKNRCCVG